MKYIFFKIIIFIILIGSLLFSLSEKKYLQLSFLDIGQGDSILIRTQKNKIF